MKFSHQSMSLLLAAALLAGSSAGYRQPATNAAAPLNEAPAAAAEFPSAALITKVRPEVTRYQAFVSNLITYFNQADALIAKSSRSPVEQAALKAKAADLKRELPQAKKALQTIMDELKTSGNFGTNLDKLIEQRLVKANSPSLSGIKSDGGGSALLNRGLNEIGSLTTEIDGALRAANIAQSSANSVSGFGFMPANHSAAVFGRFSKCFLIKVAVIGCTLIDANNCREGAEKDLKKCQNAANSAT
jgi:hypothetical protein